MNQYLLKYTYTYINIRIIYMHSHKLSLNYHFLILVSKNFQVKKNKTEQFSLSEYILYTKNKQIFKIYRKMGEKIFTKSSKLIVFFDRRPRFAKARKLSRTFLQLAA